MIWIAFGMTYAVIRFSIETTSEKGMVSCRVRRGSVRTGHLIEKKERFAS